MIGPANASLDDPVQKIILLFFKKTIAHCAKTCYNKATNKENRSRKNKEVNTMEFRIIKAEGFEILELHKGSIYEYYVKAYEKTDYIFAFAVLDRFTEHQLKVLVANGYFNHFEE